MRSPRASGWRNVHQNMRYAKRTAEIMPSPTPSTPSYLRGQARRVGATRLEPGKYSILHDPRQKSVSCSSEALRRNLFTVRRAGETWRAALPRNAWPASQSPQSFSQCVRTCVSAAQQCRRCWTGKMRKTHARLRPKIHSREQALHGRRVRTTPHRVSLSRQNAQERALDGSLVRFQ